MFPHIKQGPWWELCSQNMSQILICWMAFWTPESQKEQDLSKSSIPTNGSLRQGYRLVGRTPDWLAWAPQVCYLPPLPNSRSANFMMANLGVYYQHHLYCWAAHSHKTINVTAPENTRLGAVLVTRLLCGHSTMVLSSSFGTVGRRKAHSCYSC